MTRDQLKELGSIVPIESVPSILKLGILSHNRARKVRHTSIANAEVNERREQKVVPGGKPLHDYANLYICPRNPMLYVKKDVHETICVLRVSAAVLDLEDVVVTDANASRTFAQFEPAPEGLRIVNHDMTFATYWTHDDPDEYYRRKGLKCAEVLVPHVVEPKYIVGAYVSCRKSGEQLRAVAPKLLITVNPVLFFL
jgi:hypothetical protein